MREAGILLPLSSLPSNHGIGDMGSYSFELIDLLKAGGFRIWQILPINPLGYGNSPYQPYSSFAGDEIYISLDELYKDGLFTNKPPEFQKYSKSVDYENVRKFKEIYLKEAFLKFTEDTDYKEFIKQEWVYLYAVFLTLKKKNELRCWNEWDKEQKEWIKSREFDVSLYEEEIRYEMFVQYIFYKQWMKIRTYANQNGIRIMGDIPFYVGIDSLDVWANQECFLLGADGKPTFVAGVPPDYFSVTGQRWGNPIYDWDYLKKQNYQFWLDRIAYSSKLFDIIRIDHFRAFDTYWKIPATCETAVEGEWLEAPGYDVFDLIVKKYPEVEIVAEDLGDLREEVHVLKNHYGLKGMKIVQFTFDPNENNNNFEDIENMVIYTGSHDNQTISGWYLSQDEKTQNEIRKSLMKSGYDDTIISKRFVRLTLDSIAEMAILPLQDLINLGDEARINTPGTLGSPNWEWKLDSFNEFKEEIGNLKECIIASRR
ncbi:4-alpha-glucanotransferase [Lachnoclostridium phytofermentans]|uniref:4-alpha-glucanotransferase n=1 Tax=Lachnoclostridium phytofermentans (strain ATCC 700394 / DSM 18823 / ISDg) TaxID=357809 RepID=A9KKX8_LACP7|nr:4-alpha-glucanotransferase [Lachnoclostridium phytofermentans]ABX42710.1 4-alpha-glucanotransferase [Lachnoclostridium phytofermentans ISDg]